MIRATKLFLLVFLVVCGMATVYCQNGGYILGQLVDLKKMEPVPFASIRVKDAALGVITNIDGTFQIPERYRKVGKILEISCLGYKTLFLEMSSLSKDDPNIIQILPSA